MRNSALKLPGCQTLNPPALIKTHQLASLFLNDMMKRMKIIVVAVDFSDATPLVLKLAINFARMFPAELRLIHVIEPQPVYTAYGFTPEEFPAMNDFLTEAGRRAESKLAELLAVAQLDVPSATSQLTHGSPLN